MKRLASPDHDTDEAALDTELEQVNKNWLNWNLIGRVLISLDCYCVTISY